MNRPVIEFDAEASTALRAYQWPGNVRELENVVQRALILQPGNLVGEEDLFLDPMSTIGSTETQENFVAETDTADEDNLEDNLKHKEFQLIIEVLKKERGSRSRTAEQLGISARTLRYKLARMRECGIDLNAELAI